MHWLAAARSRRLLAVLGASTAAPALTLVDAGPPLPPSDPLGARPLPSEIYAANELQRFLAQMSGVTLRSRTTTDRRPARDHGRRTRAIRQQRHRG